MSLDQKLLTDDRGGTSLAVSEIAIMQGGINHFVPSLNDAFYNQALLTADRETEALNYDGRVHLEHSVRHKTPESCRNTKA